MSITQSVGTFKFMAPESLAGMPTANSDMFSLGMIMAVIGSGGDPFTNSGHLIDNELDWSKINVDVPMKCIIKGLTIKDQYKRGVTAFKEGWVTRLNDWIESWFEDTRVSKPKYTDKLLVGGSKLIPPHGAPPRPPSLYQVMDKVDSLDATGWHNGAETTHKPTFPEGKYRQSM
jgi:serine/threonine protein kinase